jgi:nicotinamidase/pyrazinamidase
MKTVFFDIDTQLDFLVPAGALYVPGAEKLIPRIAELNRQAPLLVSTVDAHTENDPEFKLYPPHCIAGTLGQHKPACTSLGQYILEKQALDCFTNPALDVQLREWNADRYVVYGVVTEICVRFAAFGLLKYGKPVSIVANAVKALGETAAAKMFDEFRQKGGQVVDGY